MTLWVSTVSIGFSRAHMLIADIKNHIFAIDCYCCRLALQPCFCMAVSWLTFCELEIEYCSIQNIHGSFLLLTIWQGPEESKELDRIVPWRVNDVMWLSRSWFLISFRSWTFLKHHPVMHWWSTIDGERTCGSLVAWPVLPECLLTQCLIQGVLWPSTIGFSAHVRTCYCFGCCPWHNESHMVLDVSGSVRGEPANCRSFL